MNASDKKATNPTDYPFPYALVPMRPMLSNLSKSAKVVYVLLVGRCVNKDKCWPSISTLEVDGKMARNTVIGALKELAEGEYIKKKIRNTKAGRTSTEYIIADLDDMGRLRVLSKNEPAEMAPSSEIEPTESPSSEIELGVVQEMTDVVQNLNPKKEKEVLELEKRKTTRPEAATTAKANLVGNETPMTAAQIFAESQKASEGITSRVPVNNTTEEEQAAIDALIAAAAARGEAQIPEEEKAEGLTEDPLPQKTYDRVQAIWGELDGENPFDLQWCMYQANKYSQDRLVAAFEAMYESGKKPDDLKAYAAAIMQGRIKMPATAQRVEDIDTNLSPRGQAAADRIRELYREE